MDRFRVLAAIAVVWLHTPQHPLLGASAVLAKFAVPFFAVATGYFAMASKREPSLSSAWRRAFFLYGLFVLWSAIYWLVRVAAAHALGKSVPTLPPWAEIVTSGLSNQLWFLPLALLVSFFAWALRSARWDRAPVLVLLIVAAVGALLLPRPSGFAASRFLAFSRDCALSCAVGLAWGQQARLPAHHSITGAPVAFLTGAGARLLTSVVAARGFRFALMAIIGLCSASQLWFGPLVLVENVFGMAVFAWALLAATSGSQTAVALPPQGALPLGTLALGIYLSHLLFVQGLRDIVHGPLQQPPSAAADIVIFALSVAGSAAFTALLAWASWLRFLVGVPPVDTRSALSKLRAVG